MNNDTILKMQKMRLPALVQNYREQMEHPELYDSMTFAERVALMVDAEYDTRENNKMSVLEIMFYPCFYEYYQSLNS